MSDKPRSSIKPFDLKAVKYEGNLEKLARQIGVNRHDLRNLLNQQLRPGLKILGKRFGSNIDTMAGYLNEVRKKNQAKPPKSKIVRGHPRSVNPGAPITPLARLKWLSKAHEIPYKVIQDAIDAVKTKGWDESRAIKQLLNTLDNEEVPSDQIRKFIEDQTRKITDPRGLRIDRLKEHVTKNTDIRWRTIQNALDMGKSPKQLLDDLKGNLGQDEHRYAEGLQKEFKKWNAKRRALKSAGNKIVKTDNLSNRGSLRMFKAISEGVPKSEQLAARRRLLKKTQRSRMKAGRMRYAKPDYLKDKKPGDPRLQKMSKSARNAQKLQMKQLLKQIPKPSSQLKIRNLASGLKGAATQLGAGIVINALADKFVKPHTDAAARRLGTSLGRWAKDFDEEQQKKKNAKKKKEK
jgi:hypothetical protein